MSYPRFRLQQLHLSDYTTVHSKNECLLLVVLGSLLENLESPVSVRGLILNVCDWTLHRPRSVAVICFLSYPRYIFLKLFLHLIIFYRQTCKLGFLYSIRYHIIRAMIVFRSHYFHIIVSISLHCSILSFYTFLIIIPYCGKVLF